MKRDTALWGHPLVLLVYFLCVMGFSCFYMHPICLGISLVCGMAFAVRLRGGREMRRSLWLFFPMIGITALMNPLFNHQGVTILTYLPGGNPLTLESIGYGFLAGTMVASLLVWFLCWRKVMTDDKITYLFGRIAPALALLFSMTVRFVPRFLEQYGRVRRARQGMGKKEKPSGKSSVKEAMTTLSGVTTWALENSMDTVDSMKSRGYGLPGRTSYHLFRFTRGDGGKLMILLLLAGITLAGGVSGRLDFRCFPAFVGAELSPISLLFFLSYALLCSYPLWMELGEVRRWHSMKYKD